MNARKLRLTVLILSVFLFACAKESIIKSVSIGKEGHGRAISIGVSDSLIINLASNPTTGYSWSVSKIDSAKLKFLEKIYTPSQPQLTGSGGTEMFIFSGKAYGSTELKMIYSRPWETDSPPVDSLVVEIKIKR